MGVGTTFDYKNNGMIVDLEKHDVGVVVLADPINLSSYPTVSSKPVPDGTQVIDIGRVQDGDVSTTGLFIGPEVAVSDGAGAGAPFDYVTSAVTEEGDSGGPVVQSGTHTIVAVTSGGNGTQDLLARVDLVHDWIIQQIASSGSGMPSPPANPPPPPPSAPPSGIGACADPGGPPTLVSVVLGCPEAGNTTASAGCHFTFSASPASAVTNLTSGADVGDELIDTPSIEVQMSDTATVGSTVRILADKYVADAEGIYNLSSPKSRGNVVALVQVDTCPSWNPRPGPPAPPPPKVVCTSTVRSLDLFPDDFDAVGGWGRSGKLRVSCNVPPAAGITSLTLSSPSTAVVFPAGEQHGITISPGVSNWSWSFVLERSASSITTQLAMTATPQRGAAATLTVPLRIETGRPPSVVAFGGDFEPSSRSIDFGSILPGRSSNRKLVIKNQGPGESRFRGGLSFSSSKPFALLNAQGSGAQGSLSNISSCASYIVLQSGESCCISGSCNDGTCSCSGGLQLCAANGGVDRICTDVSSDPANCGRCGNACPGTSCEGSACTSCPVGWATCSGNCVSFDNDNDNCGRCGFKCPAGRTCDQGVCARSPRD
jgi:hypothetical protein